MVLSLLTFALLAVSVPSAAASVRHTVAEGHRNCVSASFIADHPKVIAFVQSHQGLVKGLETHSGLIERLTANPSAKNLALAERALGLSDLALLVRYHSQITELVEPYVKQLACLEKHPES